MVFQSLYPESTLQLCPFCGKHHDEFVQGVDVETTKIVDEKTVSNGINHETQTLFFCPQENVIGSTTTTTEEPD